MTPKGAIHNRRQESFSKINTRLTNMSKHQTVKLSNCQTVKLSNCQAVKDSSLTKPPGKLLAREEPNVSGPSAKLTLRGVLVHPAISDLTVYNIINNLSLTMPARTTFAEARHFLDVGLRVELLCHQNPS